MQNNFMIMVLLICLTACTDIFEKNLEKQTVILLSPANNLQTELSSHTFWWEEIKQARNYNLQVVKGSFAQVQALVLDTHIVDEKFSFVLQPGIYQWRVRAYNNGSSTAFSTFTLQIDSTYDLSQQQVVLIAPSNNFITNNPLPTFQWYELYNANTYRFEIHTTNWSGSLAESPQLLSGGSYTPALALPEGTYEWGVQALNNTSASPFSTRTLVIDTTSPGIPMLVSPLTNAILPNALFTFTWNRAVDNGSTLTDSLSIYADTNLTNLVKAVYSVTTSYADSLGTGNYFWRVRTFDAAGNKSGYSLVRKFTIQ
ncbi:MAG: hypothetical protein BroJett020_02140 [Bacteroidota bacterium]|nr:MAG: hypothetical protein BroJett020_02140 [Bacteroidota bacterium]